MAENASPRREGRRTCDACGREITRQEAADGYITVTIMGGRSVAERWRSQGRYCTECRDTLTWAISEELPCPETDALSLFMDKALGVTY